MRKAATEGDRAGGKNCAITDRLKIDDLGTDQRLWPLTELLRNVGDDRGQAASGCWLTASMPSMNFTPVISFGNWLWPSRRRQLFSAACASLKTMAIAVLFERHPRAAALGIETLATRLDDRFLLLTGGRRTALPRHQTLRATLDWSYELLAQPERVVLRRLAIFAGALSLEAASAVVASP